MGQAKRELEEHEEKLGLAIALCLEFGAMDECPVHSEQYLNNLAYSPEEASDLTNEILKLKPDAINNFESRNNMDECIRDVLLDADEECAICSKYMNND